MKTFKNPNRGLCMEEHLTFTKNFQKRRVTLMNKNLEICGALLYQYDLTHILHKN